MSRYFLTTLVDGIPEGGEGIYARVGISIVSYGVISGLSAPLITVWAKGEGCGRKFYHYRSLGPRFSK